MPRVSNTFEDYIALISRVFGPYWKLRTEFFYIDLWPKRDLEKNEDPQFTVRTEKSEANKMFIIWLLPVWETENKCRTHDLTDI